jgi:hypothetical protein
MTEFVINGAVPLEEGGTLLIDEGREMMVYVWKGLVWVTQEGDGRDRLLKRGDWLRIDRDGRTVVSALLPSSVALTTPNEEDCAEEISVRATRYSQPVALYRGEPNSLRAMLNRAARAWSDLVFPARGAAGAA